MRHGLDARAGDPNVLAMFLASFRIDAPVNESESARRSALVEVVRAFAGLPYENLTKIIKFDACGTAESARRPPHEVLRGHLSCGAGGTCFSLTALLLSLVRALGFRAEPLLADRRYGDDTHSALLVWLGDRPHLLDPGYLILEPLALDTDRRQHVPTAFNELVLVPREGERLELFTAHGGRETYRLTFKTEPADPGAFLKAWDASFGWDMMRYPLLTRVAEQSQLYLQGERFQVRTQEAVEREFISREGLAEHVTRVFGLSPELIRQALRILQKKGEKHGEAPGA